jgi:hypothetical protein
MTYSSRTVAVTAFAIGLLASVNSIGQLIDRAVGSAVCREQANYLLISCIAPPDELSWLVAALSAAGFAIGIGMAIGWPRRREIRGR